MTEVLGLAAGLMLGLAMIMNFSIHKLEEGHVGVYYRVSMKWKCVCVCMNDSLCLQLMIATVFSLGSLCYSDV